MNVVRLVNYTRHMHYFMSYNILLLINVITSLKENLYKVIIIQCCSYHSNKLLRRKLTKLKRNSNIFSGITFFRTFSSRYIKNLKMIKRDIYVYRTLSLENLHCTLKKIESELQIYYIHIIII